MNAPAPALAKTERRVVTVRLADVCVPVAYLSFAFALLLVFSPVSFPRIVLSIWEKGNLIPAMLAVTLPLDVFIYCRVAYRFSAKPTAIAAAFLGSLPVIVVVGLSLLLQAAVTQTLSINLPNLQARVGEEILAHTYLGLVSAIFLPFLGIRLLQQFKSARTVRGTEFHS